jgi:hypothetical protein
VEAGHTPSSLAQEAGAEEAGVRSASVVCQRHAAMRLAVRRLASGGVDLAACARAAA